MDYVREELLRQQRALERLMNGSAPEEEEERQEELKWQRRSVDMRAELRRERTLERSRNRRQMQKTVLDAETLLQGGPVFSGVEETAGFAGERAGGTGTRTQVGVRAVSRAIERDARRYDGGFTMY